MKMINGHTQHISVHKTVKYKAAGDFKKSYDLSEKLPPPPKRPHTKTEDKDGTGLSQQFCQENTDQCLQNSEAKLISN